MKKMTGGNKKTICWGLVVFFVLILGMMRLQHGLSQDNVEIAVFAGGCFWCTEYDFDQVEGVLSTVSGYTGGHKRNPTYQEVSAGGTGHAEAVQVVFDSSRVSYEELLAVFWRNIDPTVKDRQFCDRGDQYRSAIFYQSNRQKKLAVASKEKLEKTKPFDGVIYTEIVEGSKFYPAEEYHQDFYQKNPIRYRFYRFNCGRDKRLETLWGKSRRSSGG